jgi:hypothetical protein
MNKMIISFDNNLFIVNKILTVNDTEPPFEFSEELRQFYHSDKILKKENKFYFVNQITEPILENNGEITTNTTDN